MESGHQIAFTQGEKLQSEWFDGEGPIFGHKISN